MCGIVFSSLGRKLPRKRQCSGLTVSVFDKPITCLVPKLKGEKDFL